MKAPKSSETTLKPCPFCGGEAEVNIKPYIGSKGSGYVIECNRCWAATGYYAIRENAVEAWNTRAERTCINADGDETDAWFMCSECECHVLIEYMGGGFGVPRYCPNCGAKVVEK